ncbi:HAD superfamily hydrolase (TIGR01509 family) [Deinobacterium chartae]|uniref:HAD superfamily hydrolase (TIGR01509 family) n=1 Tax=Deinobacterium chartae TaxID=521158 RepID=A0A841I8F5_9DEIO|nr:HAD family hydrolase [Deinobacterium chartae]MBB6100102.1 HAD superfamily hydrolase (TIGR01509 family) [Deinobacterium chartae]
MLRALIFDFDGTIFDTETPEFENYRALYREHGLVLELSDWQRGIGTWGVFDPWAAFAHLEEIERERLRARNHARLMGQLERSDVRPGVRELLEQAQAAGLRLAIATSSDRNWVQRWLEHHDLRAYFETLATQDDVQHVKPDPELYRLALARLGLDASEAVAIEDSLNGSLAAVRAGLRCVVVPNPVTRSLRFPPETLRLEGFEGGLEALRALLAEDALK